VPIASIMLPPPALCDSGYLDGAPCGTTVEQVGDHREGEDGDGCSHSKLRMNRTTVVVIAWIVTAVWFAAAHLPTYGWNVAQALLIIGTARLVLTLAYIRTKNIGVSVGAHIINGWTQFTLAMVIAAVAAS